MLEYPTSFKKRFHVNMNDDSRILKNNLASLRQQSLAAIAVLMIVMGYIWLWFDIWPVTGDNAPLVSWLGAGLLLGIGIWSYRLRSTHLHFATHLAVMSLLIATTCAVMTFRVSSIIYLFLLPVIFASVLLSLRSTTLVAIFASMVALVVNVAGRETIAFSDVALPVGMIMLVAFALWLSAHNLHTTLTWFGNAYEDAYHNEQVAREQQAELRRLFKALDDATYRLERMNYSLTLERNQAREAHRLKQQFAQTISHELRTPLNLIVAFTELMAQSPEYYGATLPMPYVRDLSIVHRNAQHLQNLVSDVLDLARIEAAQMTLAPEWIDPTALVQEALNTSRSLIERRGLALHIQLDSHLPNLWIDPTRIRQVLFNLLSNAVRFTDVGSITVHACHKDREVIFSVTDTGIGIAEEDISRLFRDFQQLDGTTRRRHGGAGLGLAISRRFVELHKGRIWVESEPGVGSTFAFSLPITENPGLSSNNKFAWKLLNDQPIQSPNQSLLLAVTRNTVMMNRLMHHTQEYRNVFAPNLEEAGRMAQRVLPQCVLIDTTCEDLDQTRLQRLAEEWGIPHTPFIACPLPAENVAYQPLNLAGYLTKPVSAQRLVEMTRELNGSIHRILVIDDDQDFIRLISRIFSTARSCQVIGAYNGRDGLALVGHHKPDLIFLDFNLPDSNSTQLVEGIRAISGMEDKPIIALTSQDEAPDAISQPVLLTQGNGLAIAHLLHVVRYFTVGKSRVAEMQN